MKVLHPRKEAGVQLNPADTVAAAGRGGRERGRDCRCVDAGSAASPHPPVCVGAETHRSGNISPSSWLASHRLSLFACPVMMCSMLMGQAVIPLHCITMSRVSSPPPSQTRQTLSLCPCSVFLNMQYADGSGGNGSALHHYKTITCPIPFTA
jgi:hypothetical protein